MPFYSLTNPDCFDPSSELLALSRCQYWLLNYAEFLLRDDWRYLKYAFRARDAEPNLAEDIFRQRGVRWSSFNLIPGWLPSATAVVEFMHCIFLCRYVS